MAGVRDATLQKIIDGVLTDLIVRTNTNNVRLMDGATLTAWLASEAITQTNVTSYVDTRINQVLNVNPGILDTLKALQEALEDKQDIVAEILADLADKATKAEVQAVVTSVTNLATSLSGLSDCVQSLENTAGLHHNRISAVETAVQNLGEPEVIAGLSRIMSGEAPAPANLRDVDMYIHLEPVTP